MKTKHFLLVVFFAAFSTAIFAQLRPNHFQNGKSPSYQYRSGESHELYHLQKDVFLMVDEFYGIPSVIPENKPWKNAQNTNNLVHYCDSTFSYSTDDTLTKTVYTRDANGRVQVLLKQTRSSAIAEWLNKTQELYTSNGSGSVLSLIAQDWSIETNAWVNNSRISYTYDDSLRPIYRLQQIWDIESNAWINQSKTSLTFSNSGKLLSYLQQIWDIEIGDWENQTKYSFSYDSSENVLSQLTQHWDTETASWENATLRSYAYDVLGNGLMQLSQWWNSAGGFWNNADKRTMTYDSLGYTKTVLFQLWAGDDWDIVYYEIFTHTTSGKILTCVDMKWNMQIGDYVNDWKLSYSYDESENEIEQLNQVWDSNAGEWKNMHKESHSYDAAGNMLSELYQNWSNNVGDWKNNYRYSYSYDASNNQLSELYQDWDIDLGEWMNRWKTDYEYDYSLQKITGTYYLWSGVWVVEDEKITLSLYNKQLFTANNCYMATAFYADYTVAIKAPAMAKTLLTSFCSPNPAHHQIVLSNPFEKSTHLSISNMNGKRVMEKSLSRGQNQLSIQNLPPGIYLFVIQSEDEMMRNKVVVY